MVVRQKVRDLFPIHQVWDDPGLDMQRRIWRHKMLWSEKESARYGMIAAWLQHRNQGGSILDLGCGEGVLRHYLGPGYHGRYLGIEISDFSYKNAGRQSFQGTEFIKANIMKFETQERFDFVVFNELLYYLDDPLEAMKRFERNLKEQGVFILGLNSVAHRVWNKVRAHYRVLRVVEYWNSDGLPHGNYSQNVNCYKKLRRLARFVANRLLRLRCGNVCAIVEPYHPEAVHSGSC